MTWAFGGAGIASLGVEVDDATARATVDAAWEAGVRDFDTAPHYGLGLGERRLGDALAGRPRDAFRVSTKVGRLLVEAGEEQDDLPAGGFAVRSSLRRTWDLSADGARRSLDASRERLGLDRIDVALVHDPEEHDLHAGLTEALPALARMRDDGEVGEVGVGSKSVPALLAAARTGLADVLLVAGRWTLLDASAGASLLPLCEERGIAVVAAGVLNSGALSRDEPDPRLPYEYGPMPTAVFARVQRIAEVCRRREVPLPVAALAFPGRHPAVRQVVIGVQSPEQVRQNDARLAQQVPEALWTDLSAEGLL